jgi:hypothetical protein
VENQNISLPLMATVYSTPPSLPISGPHLPLNQPSKASSSSLPLLSLNTPQ